jgi:hypothetical protein
MLGDTDITLFFNVSEFATAVTYTRIGSPATTVNGIYTPAEKDNPLQQIAIENLDPQFKCATADVPNLRHNDTFVISGVTWYCCKMDVDGTGITTVYLSKSRATAL